MVFAFFLFGMVDPFFGGWGWVGWVLDAKWARLEGCYSKGVAQEKPVFFGAPILTHTTRPQILRVGIYLRSGSLFSLYFRKGKGDVFCPHPLLNSQALRLGFDFSWVGFRGLECFPFCFWGGLDGGSMCRRVVHCQTSAIVGSHGHEIGLTS